MLNVGDKVMMMDEEAHASCPISYPTKGTIGVVVDYSLRDENALVDWGQDSGVDCNLHGDYVWWCSEKRLEKVSANAQANTQKEVCNMNKFNVGDKVVFINAQKHKSHGRYYPAVGTVGTVVNIDEHPIEDFGLLVNWGDTKGVDVWQADGTKSWWCNEADVKPYYGENGCTDDEVWEMLKPKMRQLVPAHIEDIDLYSPIVKNMVVAAYRSGYGRATKGRSFMIKPKAKKAVEKASVDYYSIDAVLDGKMIVAVYTDIGNSYLVSKFDHALNSEQGMEIHGDTIYDSDGGTWDNGFDVIDDPNCEMYVAVPFSEVVGEFDSKSIRALYCGDKLMALSNIKPWTIGKYNGVMCFSNKHCVSMTFEQDVSKSECFPEIHTPKFKALVPIRDYLKHKGVNV